MRVPTFKTKHRSYANVSPEIKRRTVEAVSFELRHALYYHYLQRIALEDAIESGKNVSFSPLNYLELLGLCCKLQGLYLVPNKEAVDRKRRLKLLDTEAKCIADETNAPLWVTRFMLRQMMNEFI